MPVRSTHRQAPRLAHRQAPRLTVPARTTPGRRSGGTAVLGVLVVALWVLIWSAVTGSDPQTQTGRVWMECAAQADARGVSGPAWLEQVGACAARP